MILPTRQSYFYTSSKQSLAVSQSSYTMAAKYRILSIDGGGVRGIVPATILVQLETLLQQQSGNPKARISDYFDMIAGTSTGGVLTCMYLLPNYSANDALQMYINEMPSVFKSAWTLWGWAGPKYSAEGIEKMADKYGGTTKLSDLGKACLIPAYCLDDGQARFFTNKTKVNHTLTTDFYLKDVVRSTTAAPTYFPPSSIANILNPSQVFHMIDGGVFANNPALCAFGEARELPGKPKIADMFILSISCGQNYDTFDYAKTVNWGKLSWADPIINTLIDGGVHVVDYQLSEVFDAADVKEQYVRFDPPLVTASHALDDYDAKNLAALQADATTFLSLEGTKEKLTNIVTFLTSTKGWTST